jgi:non-specific serine/threonine protein kinase
VEEIAALHAAWCVRLAEDVLARIHGPKGAAVLDQLETEHDNLRAALSWTIAAGETDLALRLAYAAWRLWWMHSHLEQGRTWLERALALPDTGPATTALRPMAQVAAGYFARVQGDYARASALGAEALVLAQKIGDARGVSGALHLLSLTATDCGELAEAQAHLEAGIAIDRSVDYAHGVAFGLSNLGDVAVARGRLADAAAYADEALVIWRDRGDAWSVAWAQIGCGRIARAQGDPARAVSLVCDGLAACAKLGDKEIAVRGISELAAIATEHGELRLAARLYGSVAALREAIAAPLAPTERAGYEAAVDAIRAGLPGNSFAAAWEAGRVLSLDQAVAEAAALARAASTTDRNGATAADPLTVRQREILRLLVDGLSDKEIAALLGITRRTAAYHVAAIRTKFDAPSRTAAAAIAVRDGLI